MVIGLDPKDPNKLKKGLKKAPTQTKAMAKADLDKKLDKAKDKLKGQTKDLMGALKQNMTVEMLVKNIDSVKKLREKIKAAPIQMIEKLEDKYPGITLAAFTTHLKGAEKLDFKTWSSDKIYSKFKPNTPYTINFLGNQDAEYKWGWADMASIEWRGMTKYEGGDKNKKRVSKRRIGLKGQNKPKRGCYDMRGYMAIHTKDQVMFHDVQSSFKTQFREKTGKKYKEINAKSYEKYAKSKYAKEDQKFFEKNEKAWTFISKKPTITPQLIREIRAKIGSLQGLTIPQRIEKVARYLTIPENNIGAKHCGDWVDRVYAIAGVKRKQSLYHSLNYAFVDGDRKKGWLPKKNPDGSWNQKRYDVRTHGPRAYASNAKLDQLQAGDWVWINNRNKYDYAGNHSGVFLGWEGNKSNRRARIACWFKNRKGGQTIKIYNFKNMPLVHISRAVQVDDSLPETNTSGTRLASEKAPAGTEYRSVPGIPESSRTSEWDPQYLHSNERATKEAYLKIATKMAKKACAGTPLNWRVMLAQSIQETGWGTSKNARQLKNFFGIMAHEIPSQKWRAYRTMYESFLDYRNKMLSNARYRDVLEYKNNPMMQLAIILGKGYCTNRGYFKKIIGVWRASAYGPSIGIPSGAYIDESELRSILSDSKVNDEFIEREFIRPAKAMGRYRP